MCARFMLAFPCATVDGAPLVTFEQLGLDPRLLRAIDEQGYTAPTPIQQAAIPHVLGKHDLLALAQTGTGKTAAFALPMLQNLAQGTRAQGPRPIRALILTPTRELASQIGDSFAAYGKYLPLRASVIFGGVGMEPQKQALRAGAMDILVATPGRLLDLASQQLLNLRGLEIFVLDEADRMLDMGFIHDVKRVISMLPRPRQTLFFSATMPREAQQLADVLLTKPKQVAVTPVSSTAEKIAQSVYLVDKNEKRHLLVDLLGDENMRRVLVFTRTKHGANRVAEHLEKNGIGAAAIHGNKSQSARERALLGFKEGKLRVLVATDIAARGIDIDDVTHVVNFDLPEVPETYVHRIGRTARAGREGIAFAFCDHEERDLLRGIERLIRKNVPVADAPARRAIDPAQRVQDAGWLDRPPMQGRGRGHGGHRGAQNGGGRSAQPSSHGGFGRGGGPSQARNPGGRAPAPRDTRGSNESYGGASASRDAGRTERRDHDGPRTAPIANRDHSSGPRFPAPEPQRGQQQAPGRAVAAVGQRLEGDGTSRPSRRRRWRGGRAAE